MSAKVRNDGHFEHGPWQARGETREKSLRLTENVIQQRMSTWRQVNLDDVLLKRPGGWTRKCPCLLKYRIRGELCCDCGCSFHAVRLITNRSRPVSVITAAQMAPQSAPCKEWIITTHIIRWFSTWRLASIFLKKSYTTETHKSSSYFFWILKVTLGLWVTSQSQNNSPFLLIQTRFLCQSLPSVCILWYPVSYSLGR